MPDTLSGPQSMVANAAMVANTIREALQASLPVAPEQLMTVQIPGVVIDCDEPGPYWWNPREHAETPHRVKVNEARLVDGMVPLSKLMLGPTGKSVARSYAAALDMLIPEDAPLDAHADDAWDLPRNPAAEKYNIAMDYLTSTAPNSSKSVIDVYVEKQQAWTDAMNQWEKAKQAAHDKAKKLHPNDVKQQQAFFDDWNKTSFRIYKNHTQAKYMDWIVNGCKYKVDYYFGIVDVSSALKRVEFSKESCRNLVVVDPDGATEWQEVRLDPQGWADECNQKVKEWRTTKGKLGRNDYESEINRLRRLLLSYKGLQTSLLGPTLAPTGNGPDSGGGGDNETEQQKKEREEREKEQREEKEKKEKEQREKNLEAKRAETPEDKKLEQAHEALYKALSNKTIKSGDLREAQGKVQSALEEQAKARRKKNQTYLETMASDTGSKKLKWISSMITQIEGQIDKLEKDLETFAKLNGNLRPVQDIPKHEAKKGSGGELVTVNYATEEDHWARQQFGIARNGIAMAPPPEEARPSRWTKISVSISSSTSKSDAASQSSSSAASASAAFGLFSASGGFSYSQASSEASQCAAECNVVISFEALLVTISRSWLHGELFADPELNVAAGVELSPGWNKLKDAIEKPDTTTLSKFAHFPSYPTAFVVASNIELEFHGTTTALEEAIEASSLDANLKVSYGPFSLGASHKQDRKSAKTKMESTATGTRISLEAPAIIGWVSTLLPELPRPRKGHNALVQTFI